ncbi:STAS/SEC14 domain-containing protein [Halomonas sp. M20]|uniref:STAS/SEC14 domain-containing protein n=1 Tax=Halomonas sp. M20 TaxID=2763264 RepID=UPI001D09BDD4|nr:STAS/SEC14 domain-containing protein [Halomonas sp. M20]
MLELIAAPALHVVAMRVSGCIDADDLQRGIDAIEHTKKSHDKISFFVEVDNLRWMTGTALMRDIGYGLTQFGRMHRFHRIAVVSDQQWVRSVASVQNQLFSSIEVRPFKKEEKETAMQWVCESSEADTSAEKAASTQPD